MASFLRRLWCQSAWGKGAECPICGGEFNTFYRLKNQRKICPQCSSLERNRALWLYLTSDPAFFTTPLRLLHIAPEACLQEQFHRLSHIQCFSLDINSHLADMRMDVTRLGLIDSCFDMIICSHVLEHVIDERSALAEFRRVLAPGGKAIIQIPIDNQRDATYEDATVMAGKDRLREFGQSDHVRIYGRDVTDRFAEAKFKVEWLDLNKNLSREQFRRYGLKAGEIIYILTKNQVGISM